MTPRTMHRAPMARAQGRAWEKRRERCAGVVLLLGCAMHGCSGSLPTVPLGPHAGDGSRATVVASPPPPAKIEYVPAQPAGSCLWLDGQWLWLGQHWEWQAGAWVNAPEDCYYAEPVMTWVETTGRSVLFHMRGAWYSERGGKSCDRPQTPC